MSLPPDVGGINLLAENFDLEAVGYRQSEYFLEGTATAFTNLSELSADGVWSAEPGEEAQYRTRIVVNRPIDPADPHGDSLVSAGGAKSGISTSYE